MESGSSATTVDVNDDQQQIDGDHTVSEIITHPDVLASIMAQLGLRVANLSSAVCTAWRTASKNAQEEKCVLRPSHSLGWGNQALGQFRSPSGIIALPSGELCVADTNNHRLQVLSRSGEVRGVIGHGPGAGAGEFQQPTGLACDGKFLYVADSGNCRLHKLLLPDAKPIATVGSFGEAAGQLHAPVGLALHDSPAADGGCLLFCADSRNHRIAVFATHPELRFVRCFAQHGTGAGELGPTSSGIYLAAADGELFVADRANHRLQVFSLDGQLQRTIGQRGTAPGSFRRIRGVAVHGGRLFTAECERVQVLSLHGVPLQVLPMAGSSALVGICADPVHVCVVDQTHQKVRVLSFLHGEGRAAFGGGEGCGGRRGAGGGLDPPRCGEPHLPPFLLPTEVCDCQHPSIVSLARRIIPTGCSAARAAASVRTWVRANIVYVLRDKSERASETLASREGMCTNKANLQVALLRAAGIPAGYVLAHISKEAFAGPQMLDEVYAMIQPVTVHVFCAAYIPYVPYTDETRYRARWLRGPFSPVQGNLDHLLKPGSKIPPDLLERQNALLRAHPI